MDDVDSGSSRDSRLVDRAWQQTRDIRELDAARLMTPWADGLPNYDILEEVYRGGQGAVFRALQRSTQRVVAIKVVHGSVVLDDRVMPRFEREVRILGALKHRNIVMVHDSGLSSGYAYVVMDFIRGLPLDRWLDEQPEARSDTARAVRDRCRCIARLFSRISQAVNEAHLRGVIHRDLKPNNILVDHEGEPHILDFGLAKLIDEQVMSTAQTMTATGMFVGSAPWASPEQAGGEWDTVDLRTDVYSLGVMMYQALTGEFPYPVHGRMRDVLRSIEHSNPVSPRNLTPALDDDIVTIVLRCLAKEPGRRYQTAGELGRDLDRYLAGEPIEAKRDSLLYIMGKRLRRHRVAVITATVFTLILTGATITAGILYLRAEAARHEANAARQAATRRLWEVYQTQARATRLSRRVGRRLDSLALLSQAAAIQPSLNIRNEAIAALSLCDLEAIHTLPVGDVCSCEGLAILDRYAVRGDGGVVTIHAVDGQLLYTLRGPLLQPTIMLFSSTGRYLAVKYHTDAAMTLWVWDLRAPDPRAILKLDDFTGAALAFDPTAPGARWIAVGETDGHVHVYEVPGGTPGVVHELADPPLRLCAHPAGDRLAISSQADPPVQVRMLDSPTVVATMSAPYGVLGMAWNADGRTLAGGCYDHHIYVWDGATGRLEATLSGHQSPPVSVAFGPADAFLASWGWDNTSRLWDIDRQVQLLDPIEQWKLVGVGDTLATWRLGSTFRRWIYRPPCGYLELHALPGFRGSDVGMPAEGDLVAWAGEQGLLLWRLGVADSPVTLHDGLCKSVLFLPDNGGLLATTAEGLYHWTLRRSADAMAPSSKELLWSPEGLGSACLDSTGRGIVACTRASLSRFSLESHRETQRLPAYPGMIDPVVSPDERWIFTGTWKGRAARVWDCSTGQDVRQFDGVHVIGLFSPDGRRLVVADGAAYRCFDVSDWRCTRRIARQHVEGSAGELAFTPDGRITALMLTRYQVTLFETATWTELASLPNPGNHALQKLHFSPDGHRLIISTSDDVIQVWDLAEIGHALDGMGLGWQAGAGERFNPAAEPDPPTRRARAAPRSSETRAPRPGAGRSGR